MIRWEDVASIPDVKWCDDFDLAFDNARVWDNCVWEPTNCHREIVRPFLGR